MRIAGLGHYLPHKIVTNHDLADRCNRSPEWLLHKTGVEERRWVSEETAAWMGAQAARIALNEAGLQRPDLIVNASGTPSQALPDGAVFLQKELGLTATACFSVHATCLSFLVALQMGDSLLRTKQYKSILVVSSEVPSCALNFAQPESAALFGDAAAAAVLLPEEPSCLLQTRLETYPEHAHLTEVRGGGSHRHPSTAQADDNLFSMDGPAVLRLARQHLPAFVERLGVEEPDVVIPHQASKAGLAILERLGWPRSKIVYALPKRGNTVAASIPLAWSEEAQSGRIGKGTRLLLLGTGAGFSMGALELTS